MFLQESVISVHYFKAAGHHITQQVAYQGPLGMLLTPNTNTVANYGN